MTAVPAAATPDLTPTAMKTPRAAGAAGVLLIATQSATSAEVGPAAATGLVLESDTAIFALVVILAFLYVNSAARLPRAAKVTAESAS